MNYSNIFKYFEYKVQFLLNKILLPIDRLTATRYCYDSLSFRPIFIVGPPRVGSTVLTQLMQRHLSVSCFSNLHSYLYECPTLACILLSLYNKNLTYSSTHSPLASSFGNTYGLDQPSEGTLFWNSFFSSSSHDFKSKSHEILFASRYRSYISYYKGIFLSKNLFNSLRIDQISSIFPRSLFIVLSRDIYRNALSILNARYSQTGSMSNWWSIPTQTIYQKELAPHLSVVGQIRDVYSAINSSVSNLDTNSVCYIDYNDLCSNPSRELEKLIMFFNLNQLDVHMIDSPPLLLTNDAKDLPEEFSSIQHDLIALLSSTP
jgi:hypothetical protein